MDKKSEFELFQEFYKKQNCIELDEKRFNIVKHLIVNLEDKE